MWASTTDDNAVYEQSDKRMCQLINIRGTSFLLSFLLLAYAACKPDYDERRNRRKDQSVPGMIYTVKRQNPADKEIHIYNQQDLQNRDKVIQALYPFPRQVYMGSLFNSVSHRSPCRSENSKGLTP